MPGCLPRWYIFPTEIKMYILDFVFRVSNFTGRISSTLGNANFLGGYLILLIPVSMALFFVVENLIYKIIYAINTILLVVALFFSQTLNAWIGLALGALVFGILFVIYIPKYRKLIIISAIVLISIASALVFSFKPDEAIGKLAKLGQFETFSERGRWIMWKSAVSMIKDRAVCCIIFYFFGSSCFRLWSI